MSGKSLEKVAGFVRNGWQPPAGMGGRSTPESVAGYGRILQSSINNFLDSFSYSIIVSVYCNKKTRGFKIKMGISHKKELFKDYYFNKKGTIYKSFEIKINSFNYNYDIYWGDPNIIFDKKILRETFPLAVTTIPHRNNYPNPRIYLHEKLEKKYNDIFEMVIEHEIGHLCLHDVVGFNNPSTSYSIEEKETEIWADYFSYSFFVKYRNIDCLDTFNKILTNANNLQIKIYNLKPEHDIELTLIKRKESLKLLEEKINLADNSTIIHMKKAIEITLNSLGDIFK